MSTEYVHRIRVRFGETDLQGVVFYANYVAYFDILMTEFFRDALPGGYTSMIENGVDMVVIQTTARYHAPALFDDELDLKARVTRLGTTSMSTDVEIARAGDGAVLVTGDIHHVFIDVQTKAKHEIPDTVRAGLEPYLVEPEPAASGG